MKHSRRNTLPRVRSVKGTQARAELRIKHMPVAKAEFSNYYYHKPGSLNPRKVTR